jgi:tetratricopeptide (TPR) repeat protein
VKTLRFFFCAAFCLSCLGAWGYDQQQQTDRPKTRSELLREAMKDKDYRQKLKESLTDLKEMEKVAEELYTAKNFREAASFYQSITVASIPNAEKAVSSVQEKARERLIEMENLAQDEIRKAEDADLARNYIKAIEHLTVVLRDFPFTKAKATAESRLSAFKSRKDVSSYVEFAECEAAEASGDLAKAVTGYQRLIDNPRYEGTVPVFKAKKRIEVLKNDEATRDALKAQIQAVADKEAPPILNTAKNFLMNNQPGPAKEKFQVVVDKFPGTTYAEEAQKEIEKLQ